MKTSCDVTDCMTNQNIMWCYSLHMTKHQNIM